MSFIEAGLVLKSNTSSVWMGRSSQRDLRVILIVLTGCIACPSRLASDHVGYSLGGQEFWDAGRLLHRKNNCFTKYFVTATQVFAASPQHSYTSSDYKMPVVIKTLSHAAPKRQTSWPSILDKVQ